MHWRRCDLWKIGIVIAGMVLILPLMTWVPLAGASAHEETSRLATPGTVTVQVTPTEDATVTALNKEKLAQEVQQLKEQNEPDFFGWFRANASILLSTLVVVIGGLIGLWRWLRDRRDEHEKRREDQRNEQEKRAEERFQAIVEGLGSEREEARVGAAIMLQTFLQPGYEQFYKQVFDLSVAHLRRRNAATDVSRHLSSPKDLLAVSSESFLQDQKNGNPSLTLDSLSQAFITVFKKSFPIVRNLAKKQNAHFDSQSLDATGIQLDNAYLYHADLAEAWLPYASLQKTNLEGAHLEKAYLRRANLQGAYLRYAHLQEADFEMANFQEANLVMAYFVTVPPLKGVNLQEANHSKTHLTRTNFEKACLEKAYLQGADLKKAHFQGADLKRAYLQGADLRRARLERADLRRAHLQEANLNGAHLEGAHLEGTHLEGAHLEKAFLAGANLSGANLEDAVTLKNTDLRGAIGLTKEQLAVCKAKGAIIGEAPTTSSSQPVVAPSPPPQSHDAQASSAPSAQGSLPSSDAGGSSAVSPQQDSES